VLDCDSAPSPKRAHTLIFGPCLYCGQTAGRIKMPLGTEIDLRPGDIVLDANAVSPPPQKRGPPILSPCLLWSNGWMHQVLVRR